MKQTLLWILPALFCLGGRGQSPTTAVPSDGGKAAFTEAQEYYFGLGRPYDPGKAFHLYQQAADAGHASAMNALANMYARGTIVPRDLATAFRWYEKAGQAGEPLAYNNLAQFYRQGTSVPQDFEKAAAYYRKGAALGNDLCRVSLAYFYFKGLGVEQSYPRAFAIYKELAAKGDVNAQYFTGLCYRNGYGVTADASLAKEWLEKAAARNDGQALHELNAEALPENISVVDASLQKRMTTLLNFKEDFMASGTNDIGGAYTGYAIYFDFSRQYVHEIVPLTLTLDKKGNLYEGVWTEGDSLKASIKADFFGNRLKFDSSSKYTRHNYYSYREAEPYQFNSASLDLKYISDSLVLSGYVQFYSILRREPGQPVFIVLRRKALENARAINYFKLNLSPNPATKDVQASFTLSEGGKVQLDLLSMDGKPLQQVAEKTLPAGTYTHTLVIEGLAAGNYILRMRAGNKVENKIFVKL